jgi:hypothetical protein
MLLSGSLTVNGTSTIQNTLTLNGSNNVIRSGNELRFNRADNAVYTRLYDAGSLAANGFILDNINGEGFHFQNNGTTIMRMNSSGNVGINRNNPTRTLDILGATGIGTLLKLEGASGTTTYLQLAYNGATNAQSGYIGYNSSSQLLFFTNDTLALTIDSNRNLGLGVTPSTWTLGRAIEVGNVGNGIWNYGVSNTNIVANSIWNNGNKYASNGFATQYAQNNGNHEWLIAPSGTSGNAISFTQPMSLTSNGNLLIGTTTDNSSRFQVTGTNSGSVPLVNLVASGTGTFQRGVRLLNSGMNSGDHIMYAVGQADGARNMGQFYFQYNGAGSTSNRISMGLHSVDDVFNILGTGNVGIGTTSPGSKLQVEGGEIRATTTNGGVALYRTGDTGEVAAYNWAGSAYLNLNLVGLFHTFSTSGTERMRITSGGNVGVGTTSPSGRLHVTTTGITASAPSLGWPVHNAELDTNSRSVFIDTAGNGGVGTAGQGATISLILGQYFDSRVIITTPGAGSSSPSDQGTGRGRDMMIKAGAADNTVGYSGGRLYLNGGIGYGAGGFNANGGHIIMQGLTGSGNVGIGKVPIKRLDVEASVAGEVVQITNARNNASGDYVFVTLLGANAMNTNNYHYIAGQSGGSDRLYIYGNGNVVNTNGSYGTLSDISLKENIVDATQKLADLIQLKVRNFNLIGSEEKQIGFIAQEFEEIFPKMVDVDGKSGMKTIKTTVLVPMLVKAIQELKQEIDSLKNQIK